MEQQATTFTFLPSYYEAVKDLPEPQKNKLLAAICEYGVTGKEPDLNGLEKSVFTLVKPIIDKDVGFRRTAKDNGTKGGAPKGNQNAAKNKLNSTAQQPNDKPKSTQNNPASTVQQPKIKHENENENENDINNITAGTVTDFYKKFDRKKQVSPTLPWQADANRLAQAFKLDLDASYEKKSGQTYPIADSWFKLFRDGRGQTMARLEAAYSYFADQERFLALPDDVKWGYLRDIAHNGLEKFKQKGKYVG